MLVSRRRITRMDESSQSERDALAGIMKRIATLPLSELNGALPQH